jgi:hypothetical protein
MELIWPPGAIVPNCSPSGIFHVTIQLKFQSFAPKTLAVSMSPSGECSDASIRGCLSETVPRWHIDIRNINIKESADFYFGINNSGVDIQSLAGTRENAAVKILGW